MNHKKKHHYLPQVYLQGFCNDKGMVYCFDKISLSNYCGKPKEIGFEKYLYRLQNISDNNLIENFFAEAIEYPASEALKDLRKQKFPGEIDRNKLSIFIGTLLVRSPGYLNNINRTLRQELQLILTSSANNKNLFHLEYKKASIEADEDTIESDRKSILNGNVNVESHQNFKLSFMLLLGLYSSQLINKMNWALIETDYEYPFITSDNVMTILNQNLSKGYYMPGLGNYESCLFLPISSKFILMMVNRNDFIPNQIFNGDRDLKDTNGGKIRLKMIIKELNKEIAMRSYKKIFCCTDSDRIKNMLSNCRSSILNHP